MKLRYGILLDEKTNDCQRHVHLKRIPTDLQQRIVL